MQQREFDAAITHATAAALGRMAGIPILHLAPLRALIDEIRGITASLAENTQSSDTQSEVRSIELKRHRRLKLSLVYLPPGGRIPIHDHPCNIGVLEVIRGRVVVEQFERREKAARRRTLPMVRRSRRVLDTGDRSEITPSGPNLHSISSAEGATLLSAVYSSNGRWTRHWYAPVADEGSHVNAVILDDPGKAQAYPEPRKQPARAANKPQDRSRRSSPQRTRRRRQTAG